MAKIFVFFGLFLFVLSQGCTSHKVDVEVKPMHITIDVNIKIDRELENFFGDLDEAIEDINDVQK
ncbi:MAG: hypothetical protein MRJ65_08130 [Candidatus Brocadiaceae bacterium]|nr:hypothetical protein [Candidatus Brocadiaceae bacterium]